MVSTEDAALLIVNILRVLTAVGVLVYAAYMDWKKREVEDHAWMIMEGVGFLLLVVNLVIWRSDPWHYLFLLPIFTACAYSFWGSPELKEAQKGSKPDIVWSVVYAASVVILILYIYFKLVRGWLEGGISDEARILFTMFVVILLYYLMYYANLGGIHLLHGGADAKGMIALSVLVPLYPVIWDLPLLHAMEDAYLDLFVPFSFSVLMNAAWIPVLFYIFYFPIRNFAQGSISPYMFFGYRMDINKVEKSHVWLMQRCGKNKVQQVVLFPAKLPEPKEDIKRLKKLGVDRVWVTPKIPFMIPILISTVLTVVFGNLLVEAMWFVRNLITGG